MREPAARRDELADQLERRGTASRGPSRYVIAGTATREEAGELAKRVHGEVEPGGELVWEVAPQNPFAVFGGLGRLGLRRPEIGRYTPGATPAGDSRSRPFLTSAAHHRAASMQKTTEQPTTASEATDGLTAAALRAEAWAGEPFLREGEDPGRRRSRPGPRAGARSTTRSPRSRRAGASRRPQWRVQLRADARARARARRASGRTSRPAPSSAATRSTRSPGC